MAIGTNINNGDSLPVACSSGYVGGIKLNCNNGKIEVVDKCVVEGEGCVIDVVDYWESSYDGLDKLIATTTIMENNESKTFYYQDGYTGFFDFGCEDGSGVVYEYVECKKNCSGSELSDILGDNIKSYIKCSDTDCSSTIGSSFTTLSDEYYNEDTIKIDSCEDGYSHLIEEGDNKFIYARCNDGKWEVTNNQAIYKCRKNIIQFNYTGGPQTWTIPEEVKGKKVTFELYGARGGGGYSYGKVINGASGGYTQISGILTDKYKVGQVLHIVVAGAGKTPTSLSGTWAGGYNGGGEGDGGTGRSVGGGGGATHIATKEGNSNGLLKGLINDKDAILAVAGGSGGGYNYSQGYGGGGTYGGGDGGDGANYFGAGANNNCNNQCQAVTCGTKGDINWDGIIFCSNGVGTSARRASFGQGGNGEGYDTYTGAGGGGGGYYGGGGSAREGGGGGSAYCDSFFTCSGIAGGAVDVNNEYIGNNDYQYGSSNNCVGGISEDCKSYGSGHGEVIISW